MARGEQALSLTSRPTPPHPPSSFSLPSPSFFSIHGIDGTIPPRRAHAFGYRPVNKDHGDPSLASHPLPVTCRTCWSLQRSNSASESCAMIWSEIPEPIPCRFWETAR